MTMIEDIRKFILDGEKAVKEAEMGIRILKAAEEDTVKEEGELKIAKDRLSNIKKAVAKETGMKA